MSSGPRIFAAARIGRLEAMFSTCLFCKRQLGANQSVETFPVGRRLAFDGAHGRLWVVCSRCERWNLSPMEERWEAIEECERLYRDTRTRVASEHIGLARLQEGLELVRIGAPLRPEFAAWRYGDQFGRRRRRAFLWGGAGIVAVGGIMIGSMVTGIASGAVLSQSGNLINVFVNARTLLRIRTGDGRVLKLRNTDLLSTRIIPADAPGRYKVVIGTGRKAESFTGDAAERAASLILPRMNRAGARAGAVQAAVGEIETRGGPEAFLQHAIERAADPATARARRRWRIEPGTIARLPQQMRLALEMALHEEQERRALEGELAVLEAAWREAEEIAKIADDLLVPAGDRAFIDRHRPDSES